MAHGRSALPASVAAMAAAAKNVAAPVMTIVVFAMLESESEALKAVDPCLG